MHLRPPPSPRLPDNGNTLTPAWGRNLVSALRSYFTLVSSSLTKLLGQYGGQYVHTPYGFFYNDADQTFVATGTAYAVQFPDTFQADGITVASNTQITAPASGVYTLQFSGQLVSSTAATKEIYVWLSRDGSDLGETTRQFTISGSSFSLSIETTFLIDLAEDEYVEVQIATTDTDVSLDATAAVSPHPGIAASRLVVYLVSAFPDTRPTLP